MAVDEILMDLTLGLLIASMVLIVYHWKHIPDTFRYLGLYLGWNLLVELAVLLLPAGTNNLPLLHLYTLLEFILFSLVYKKMGLFGRWPDRLFWFFIIGISLLIFVNSLFVQDVFSYNSYAKTLVQLLLIACAVGFIFQIRPQDEVTLAQNLMNSSILIYYSGSLFLFMFGDFFSYEMAPLWIINVVLNFVSRLLILISIWKASRIRKSPFSSFPES